MQEFATVTLKKRKKERQNRFKIRLNKYIGRRRKEELNQKENE